MSLLHIVQSSLVHYLVVQYIMFSVFLLDISFSFVLVPYSRHPPTY